MKFKKAVPSALGLIDRSYFILWPIAAELWADKSNGEGG